jgi:hypothetical protein
MDEARSESRSAGTGQAGQGSPAASVTMHVTASGLEVSVVHLAASSPHNARHHAFRPVMPLRFVHDRSGLGP